MDTPPPRTERPDSEEIFLSVVDLPPAERAARLAGVHRAVRAEVEAMLAGLEAGAWLERPLHDGELSIAALLSEDPDGPDGVPAGPSRVGPFRIRRLLGRGGHAAVYLALQTDELRRWVALKVLLGSHDGESAAARFDAERRTLALLEHRGVPRIFASGRDELGRPYFVMELVRGDWITRWCRDRRLDRRERIELFREAVDAVASAHAKGIIHRDLKPANVMVGESGGRPQVKVIDFGIARSVKVGAPAMSVGDASGPVGSLSTMSPEQIRGGAEAANERSDVYALGAILFELLADRAPRSLRDRPVGEIVREILDREPPRLSSAAPECRGDLDAIVGKAMASDPCDRYATARELDADLARWLTGDPVEARVPGLLEGWARAARRRRGRIGAGIGIFLLILALVHHERGRLDRRESERESGRLMALLDESSRRRGDADANAARLDLYRQVIAATGGEAPADAVRSDRRAIRAEALVGACEPGLLEEGDPARIPMLEEAIALLRAERAARPADPAVLEDLSLALVRRGDEGGPWEARPVGWYREARELDAELHREHPTIRRFEDNLLWSHDRLGLGHLMRKEDREARAEYAAMAVRARSLLAAHGESPVTRHSAARAFLIEGCFLARDGELLRARSSVEAALDLNDSILDRCGGWGDCLRQRYEILAAYATIAASTGADRRAVERADEAGTIAAWMFPDDPEPHRRRAVVVRLALAERAARSGDFAAATEFADEVRRRLASRDSGRRTPVRASEDSGPDRGLELRLAAIDALADDCARLLDAIEDDPLHAGEEARALGPFAAVAFANDVLTAAESLEAGHPELAARCRRVADVVDLAATDRWSGDPVLLLADARRARLAGRPDEARRLAAEADRRMPPRFDFLGMVERAVLWNATDDLGEL